MRRRAAAVAAILGFCAVSGLPAGARPAVMGPAAGAAHTPAGPRTAARADPSATPGGAAPQAAEAGMGLRRAEIVLRHEGQRLAAVRADRVTLSPDARYAVLSPSVEGEVYDDGRVWLRVRCDEMVIDRETNDLTMRGRMEVMTSNGDRVSAPEARWDGLRKQLTFPSGLHLAGQHSTISARRASAGEGLRVLDLADDVMVTFPIAVNATPAVTLKEPHP